MLHFPSKLPTNLGPNGVPRRTDSLNATQQLRSATAAGAHPLFLKVEEELHDARRVHADGQEDDLRYALNMVIDRVSNLSSLLSEAYKSQADLEVQLNVAKSNLQLVIANNEMLEDALRRDTSGQAKDVGWRRSSARDSGGSSRSDPRSSLERSQSVEYPLPSSSSASSVPPSPPSASSPVPSSTAQDNRFFKFRFNNSTTSTVSQPSSRTGSVNGSPQVQPQHLTSPSLPSLSNSRTKEVEELEKELRKEKLARKTITEAKTALEEELESLSQALFEEANKMVATERKLRADAEEELNELKREKEALRSALVLVEGENTNLRLASPQSSSMGNSPQPSLGKSSSAFIRAHTRSASEIAIKSRPVSLDLNPSAYPPLPPSPTPSSTFSSSPDSAPVTLSVLSPASPGSYDVEDAQPTPRSRGPTELPEASQAIIEPTAVRLSRPIAASSSTPVGGTVSEYTSSLSRARSSSASSIGVGFDFDEPSPWADVPSRSRPGSPSIGQ